jgi:hypothetical protein
LLGVVVMLTRNMMENRQSERTRLRKGLKMSCCQQFTCISLALFAFACLNFFSFVTSLHFFFAWAQKLQPRVQFFLMRFSVGRIGQGSEKKDCTAGFVVTLG